MSRAPRDIRSATPELGEHTDEIQPIRIRRRHDRETRARARSDEGLHMADAAENAKPDAAPGTMHVRKENGIGWMIYDQQAKYNAVTYDMRRAIPGIMADFEADDDVRVAVIAGAGKRPHLRTDISQFGEKRSSEEARRMYDEASEQANLAMRNFPKPMIAMIHGYCLGAGVPTAMLCDFRIAADNAHLRAAGELGRIRLWRRRRSGEARRAGLCGEMLFTGNRYGAKDAWRMGMVNRLVPLRSWKRPCRKLPTRLPPTRR